MTVFVYKAVNAQGRRMTGKMEAANFSDLESRLKLNGLDFITGKPTRQKAPRIGKIPRRELINFCFHLAHLNRAGIPLIDSLIDLRDSLSHRGLQAVVAKMIERIEGGLTLSDAMSEQATVFNPVFCSLIRAGEHAGQLPEVLQKLHDSLKQEDELRARTMQLLLYPAFVGSLILAVSLFLMLYLVPQLGGFIQSMGQTIPLQTRILLALSQFTQHYWLHAIVIMLMLSLGLKTLLALSSNARFHFDAWILKLPVVGPVLRKIVLSRFAGVFAMLYAAGIPILEGIRMSENSVGNLSIQAGLHRIGALIAEGKNMTLAFQEVGLFPPLVIRMIRIGESTGALDATLLNVRYFYDRDVSESISRIQALIEPAMTLILGAILGGVMLAVLGPVYDLISQFKV